MPFLIANKGTLWCWDGLFPCGKYEMLYTELGEDEEPCLHDVDFDMINNKPGWVRVSPYDYESQQIMKGTYKHYIEALWLQCFEMKGKFVLVGWLVCLFIF